MPVSKDTVSFIYRVNRARGVGSGDVIESIVTLLNVTNFKKVEPTLEAGSTGWTASMSELGGGPIQGYILITPQPVSIKVNGQAGERCGSLKLALDTDVSSLVIDNNLLTTPADVRIELWLITYA